MAKACEWTECGPIDDVTFTIDASLSQLKSILRYTCVARDGDTNKYTIKIPKVPTSVWARDAFTRPHRNPNTLASSTMGASQVKKVPDTVD